MIVPTSKKPIQKHGLGRGFATLIPTELLDESFDPTASQDQQVSELRQIKLDQIIVDETQPRKDFNEKKLTELAASIKEHGVIQPIIVTSYKNGYQIVAGERRFRASKIAGLDKIPALVRKLTDQHKLELSLIENLQRSDLNPIETATAYLKLRDQFNLTYEQIGKRVGGLSLSAISNTLRLLRLPDEVKKYLVDGQLTEAQARCLISLETATLLKVIPMIIEQGWSVRKIEQFASDLKKNLENNDVDKSVKLSGESRYKEQIARIQKRFGADVAIRTNSKGAGAITIRFKSEEQLEKINKLLTEV